MSPAVAFQPRGEPTEFLAAAGSVDPRVDAAPSARLAPGTDEAFAPPAHGGFCTRDELREMTASGRVAVAAHGSRQVRLDAPPAPLVSEIEAPQEVLATRLGRKVDSLVFPFECYSRRALDCGRHRYRYALRLGGALNRDWNQELLHRVDANAMESPTALLAPPRLAR